MKTLEIELTNRGVFNEVFFGIKKTKNIQTKRFFDFLTHAQPRMQFKDVLMRGIGDPIRHPDFKEIVKFLLDRGMHVSIFTFPQTASQYVKIFGYANPGISYIIYHYPDKSYESWMKKMETEIPLKLRTGIAYAGFGDMFIFYGSSRSRLTLIYKKRKAALKPAGIISVLNGTSLVKKEALPAIKLHRVMGLRKSIHWEDGNIWERQCSYMRGERMFINSDGFASHCHFLSHHNNTKIFELSTNNKTFELLPLHYARQLEWRKQKIVQASRKAVNDSVKYHVSPCSYCQAYFFEQGGEISVA